MTTKNIFLKKDAGIFNRFNLFLSFASSILITMTSLSDSFYTGITNPLSGSYHIG